jgi:hypothetical protein
MLPQMPVGGSLPAEPAMVCWDNTSAVVDLASLRRI